MAILPHLIYFAFFQSIFLLLVFTLSKKTRQSVNRYLIVLISVMMLGLSGRVLLYSFEGFQKLYSLSEYAIFMFGATVYLFTKSTFSGSKPYTVRDLLHYVPGMIYAVVVSVYYVFASEVVIRERLESGQLFSFVAVFMGTGLVVNFVYWIMACKQYWKFKRQLGQEASYSVQFNFFQYFLLAVGASLVCWLTVYLMGIIDSSWLERSARPFIWLSICLLILFIAYYSMRQPELFLIAQKLVIPKYVQSKLSDQELDLLKKRLDQLMKQQKPYLNRKLMKADLAKMLDVNSPDVARLLNEKIGMNFFEYVNYFRILEFVELARSDRSKHFTFFGLAQEAGFNSKTTFHKSFKKIMGSSPREFFSKEGG